MLGNPFLADGFKIDVISRLSGSYFKDVGDDGMPIFLPKMKYIESEEYVRFYKRYKKDLNALPLNSKGLLWWVLGETECGRDHVILNRKRCLKENRISLSTYWRCLRGLEKGRFIQNIEFGDEDVYWLNPKYFYNGSRVKKYKQYINKKS